MKPATEIRMFKLNDEVVTMGAPGRFRVVGVQGDQVTIESADGIRKVVLAWNLRQVSSADRR